MAEADDPRSSRSWITGILSGLTLGLAVNALSDAYPGAFAVACSAAALLVIAAASRLRRIPASAPIHLLLPRVVLLMAAVGATASLFFTGRAGDWLLLIASTSAAIGCVRPGPLIDILFQLLDVATIAVGVAAVGAGVQGLVRGLSAFGLVSVGAGLIISLFVPSIMWKDGSLNAKLKVSSGLFAIFSVFTLVYGLHDLELPNDRAAGFAFLLLGAAGAVSAAALTTRSQGLLGLAIFVIGLVTGGYGIIDVRREDVLPGVAFAIEGVGAALLGVALFLAIFKSGVRALYGVAFVIFGFGISFQGLTFLGAGSAFPSLGAIAYVFSGIVMVLATVRRFEWDKHVYGWALSLVHEPAPSPAGNISTETETSAPSGSSGRKRVKRARRKRRRR